MSNLFVGPLSPHFRGRFDPRVPFRGWCCENSLVLSLESAQNYRSASFAGEGVRCLRLASKACGLCFPAACQDTIYALHFTETGLLFSSGKAPGPAKRPCRGRFGVFFLGSVQWPQGTQFLACSRCSTDPSVEAFCGGIRVRFSLESLDPLNLRDMGHTRSSCSVGSASSAVRLGHLDAE